MNKAVSVCDANSSGLRKRGRRFFYSPRERDVHTAHAAGLESKVSLRCDLSLWMHAGQTLKSESAHTKSEKLHSAHRIITLDGVMDKYTWITKD
jgi:hypothetical protein